MTDTLRAKLIQKGWVTPFNADTLVRLIEEHYADEPAVPEGREPASVATQPSDRELLELMPETMRDEFAYAATTCSDATGGQVKPRIFRVCLNTAALEYARAVLARWGHQPAPSAAGEPSDEDCWQWYTYCPEEGLEMYSDREQAQSAAQSIMGSYEVAAHSDGWHEDMESVSWGMLVPVEQAQVVECKAAEPDDEFDEWVKYELRPALYGHQPAPPADGEVAELVAWLKQEAHDHDADFLPDASVKLLRTAELLQRQVLVPVSVSERLPAMVTDGLRVAGDCDEQGRCRAGTRAFVDTSGDRDIDYPPSWELREVRAQDDVWLPAHALPLPEVNNG